MISHTSCYLGYCRDVPSWRPDFCHGRRSAFLQKTTCRSSTKVNNLKTIRYWGKLASSSSSLLEGAGSDFWTSDFFLVFEPWFGTASFIWQDSSCWISLLLYYPRHDEHIHIILNAAVPKHSQPVDLTILHEYETNSEIARQSSTAALENWSRPDLKDRGDSPKTRTCLDRWWREEHKGDGILPSRPKIYSITSLIIIKVVAVPSIGVNLRLSSSGFTCCRICSGRIYSSSPTITTSFMNCNNSPWSSNL